MAPEFTEASSQNEAREVLNGISHYGINPIHIKMPDTSPCKTGGEGVVRVGTIELPGEGWARAKLYINELKKEAGRHNLSLDSLRSYLPRLKVESKHWPHGMPLNLAAEMIAMSPEALNQWRPKVKVAVKMLKCYEKSAKRFKSFAHELSLMAELSHPNVIEMIGFVEDMENGEAWIILPWETNGNVREFLHSGPEWDLAERMSLIQDTARGLEYLHSHQPPICHGDLKSLNILVNSCYRAVITDFGSARIKQHVASGETENPSERPRGEVVNDARAAEGTSPEVKFDPSTSGLTLTGPLYSLRWAAPEIIGGAEQDLPSDMWAIGWIGWEIITGKMPFEELNIEGAIIHSTVTGKLPAIRKHADLSHVLRLCTLMSECWHLEPGKRIDASAFQRKVGFIPAEAPSSAEPLCAGAQKTRSAALLLKQGQIYEHQGDEEKALSHYQAAMDLATQTENDKEKGNALRYLGNLYRTQSKHHEAEQAFMEAHHIYSRMGNDLGVASALWGRGEIHWIQAKYDQAEKAFSEAHQVFSRSGDQLNAANALLGLAKTYKTELKYREAEQAYMDAHEVYSRIGNDLGAANALDGLGEIYRAQSKYREAEKVFVEAHDIHSRIGNLSGASAALLGLGSTYRAQSRFQEAEKALKDAYKSLPPDHNSHHAGNILRNLGILYQDQGRQNEAEVSYRQALAAYDRADTASCRVQTLLALGTLYHTQARYSDAEEAIAEALAIGVSLDNDRLRAIAHYVLAQIFRSQSKHTEELESLLQMAGSWARIGQHREHAESLRELGATHMVQGMYAEAEEYYRHAQAIFSSIEEATGEARVLIKLGVLCQQQGRRGEAEECFARARVAYATVADVDGQAKALDRLMVVYTLQGKFGDAKAACMEACEMYAQRGQPMSKKCAQTWKILGLEESSLGSLFASHLQSEQ